MLNVRSESFRNSSPSLCGGVGGVELGYPQKRYLNYFLGHPLPHPSARFSPSAPLLGHPKGIQLHVQRPDGIEELQESVGAVVPANFEWLTG